MFAFNHPYLNRQLAIRLGKMNAPESKNLLLKLANQNRNDVVLCEAIISGISGKEEEFLSQLKPLPERDSLTVFLKNVIKNKRENKIKIPQLPTAVQKDNRTAGFEFYNLYCAACHGLDGIGKENLAPPLLNSEYVGGSKNRLIALTLNGLQGAVTVNGKRYEMNAAMPGIKNNPSLSDRDIADLLTFLRNSFSFSNPWVSEKEVSMMRAQLKDREELFTEEELKDY